MRPTVSQAAKVSSLLFALVLLLGVSTTLLLQWTSGYARAEIVNSLSAISRTSISLIDVSRIANLAGVPEDVSSPDFVALRSDLQRVRASAPEVRFVYFIGRKGDNFIFLVDAEPENSDSYSPPGSLLASATAPNTEGLRQAMETGALVIKGPYEDRWGQWVSALTPIKDARNQIVAVLGVDVPAERWNAVIWRYRGFGLLISALFAATVMLSAAMILLQQRSRRNLEIEIGRQKQLELKLRELSQIDGLTKIANRRHFDEALQLAWQQACLTAKPLALLMADIDRFKNYNDTHGHVAGDGVLSRVAQTLAGMMRMQDSVARYGGEEFVVILGDCGEDQAFAVAERIRAEVEALGLPHGSAPFKHVTMSIGVASLLPDAAHEPTTLLAASDRALYKAKSMGGNVVSR